MNNLIILAYGTKLGLTFLWKFKTFRCKINQDAKEISVLILSWIVLNSLLVKVAHEHILVVTSLEMYAPKFDSYKECGRLPRNEYISLTCFIWIIYIFGAFDSSNIHMYFKFDIDVKYSHL